MCWTGLLCDCGACVECSGSTRGDSRSCSSQWPRNTSCCVTRQGRIRRKGGKGRQRGRKGGTHESGDKMLFVRSSTRYSLALCDIILHCTHSLVAQGTGHRSAAAWAAVGRQTQAAALPVWGRCRTVCVCGAAAAQHGTCRWVCGQLRSQRYRLQLSQPINHSQQVTWRHRQLP